MKLGISSYTYTWAIGVPGHSPPDPLSVHGLLEKAHELGIYVVQIADNMPLHRFSPDKIASLVNYAKSAGIQIEVGTRGIAPAHLRHYIDLAVQLASPILRVVVDTADHQSAPDEVVRMIDAMLPALKTADVTLAIENHDRFTCETLSYIMESIDDDHVGICLDTANSFGALQAPEIVVQELGRWVVNLHIKDFAVIRASHQMGFRIEGRPAGQGRLNVPWLLESLRTFRRDFNAILELWTPPEVSLSETIFKEENWAAGSVRYLRDLIPD